MIIIKTYYLRLETQHVSSRDEMKMRLWTGLGACDWRTGRSWASEEVGTLPCSSRWRWYWPWCVFVVAVVAHIHVVLLGKKRLEEQKKVKRNLPG